MPAFLMPFGAGRPVPLDKAIILIGRHPECDIVLTHSRKVSRKHCCIAQVNDRLVVRDLGSMNGVRINGQRVKVEAQLSPGDELAIGDVFFTVRVGTSESDRPRVPRTPSPEELSQEVPVPIPEQNVNFAVEPSAASVTPAPAEEAFQASAGPADNDDSDDVIPLADDEEEAVDGSSARYGDSGSQVEVVSD